MQIAQTAEAAAPKGALEVALACAVAESLDVVNGYQARVDDALTTLETMATRARNEQKESLPLLVLRSGDVVRQLVGPRGRATSCS